MEIPITALPPLATAGLGSTQPRLVPQEAFGFFKPLLEQGTNLEREIKDLSLGEGMIEKVAPLMAQTVVDFEFRARILSTALSAYKSLINMQI